MGDWKFVQWIEQWIERLTEWRADGASSRPLKIGFPVLIFVALAAAYLSAGGERDVTSVEAEALQSSTLPIDDGVLALPPAGGGQDRSEVEGFGSGSTIEIDVSSSSRSWSATPAGPVATATAAITSPRAPTTTSTAQTTTVSSATSTSSTLPTTAGPPTTPTSVAPTTEPPTTTAPVTSTTTVPPTTAPPITVPPAECQSDQEFEWVFRDDFNGTSLSAAWAPYDSPGNAGFGLRRPWAITVENGLLVMTAKMVDGALVSGGMAHRYDQTYGKYVFRVRTDEDPDLATSGVVLTWPESQQHPRDGENNIYETLNYDVDRDPFYSVIHKPFGGYTDHIVRNHNADATKWQTMTMEWRPNGITIVREGPGYAGPIETWYQPETSDNWIPDVPHHLTVQLDAWKNEMSTEVRMEIDFVEIYRYCGG